MRRLLSPWALRIIGSLLVLIAPLPWLLGWAVILASGGAEYHAIRETGLPSSVDLLAWSNWKSGTSELRRSHILHDLDPNAKIIEYRTGSAVGYCTQFIFYQAKYELPDGAIRVAHADGPRSLISHRTLVVVSSLVICLSIAIVLFIIAARLRRSEFPRAVSE